MNTLSGSRAFKSLKVLLISAACGAAGQSFGAEGGQGFFGANFGVGQSYSSKPGTPGIAYDMGVEPGYAVSLGSWSRAEAGLELGFGTASYRAKEDTLLGEKLNFTMTSIMPKLGYGYSLGDGLWAVWKVGVGPSQLKYTGKDKDSINSFSGNILAIGLRGEFLVVLPAGSAVDFTAGVKVTHISGDLGDTDVSTGTTTTKVDLGTLNMNLCEASLGARLKF